MLAPYLLDNFSINGQVSDTKCEMILLILELEAGSQNKLSGLAPRNVILRNHCKQIFNSYHHKRNGYTCSMMKTLLFTSLKAHVIKMKAVKSCRYN